MKKDKKMKLKEITDDLWNVIEEMKEEVEDFDVTITNLLSLYTLTVGFNKKEIRRMIRQFQKERIQFEVKSHRFKKEMNKSINKYIEWKINE